MRKILAGVFVLLIREHSTYCDAREHASRRMPPRIVMPRSRSAGAARTKALRTRTQALPQVLAPSAEPHFHETSTEIVLTSARAF